MRRPARFRRAIRTLVLNRLSRRTLAIGATIAIVAGLGGVAAAVQVGGGTLGGFEIDGNFAVDSGGNKDWTTVPVTQVIDDTADSGFRGSSKELKPSAWYCNTGGAHPNKANILRAYVSPDISTSGQFLNLGFVAQNIQGKGDVHINFEFNQHGTAQDPSAFTTGPCPISRTAGDFLVTFDFPGGDPLPTINLFKWQPAAHPDSLHDGNWIDQNLSADDAKAAVNASSVTDVIGGGTVNAQRFGEATIDLAALYGQDSERSCHRDGFVNVRSRSSGESIRSALQDKLPTTGVDLSTCGSIVLHKVNDHVPPQALAGAEFGLFQNSAATGDPVDTCASGTNGKCSFDGVNPGNYWLKELQAPDGYSPDPHIVAVTVGVREHVDVETPFVDPRDVGSLRIIKQLRDEHGDIVTPPDPHVLDGASFLAYRDANSNNSYDPGEEAKLWPAETSNAACTITGGAGHCDIGPLPTGTYRVHETTAPTETGKGPDVGPVVVTKNARVDVTYTNSLSPLNISIDKSGPANAHVGDTIHYSFAISTTGPKLHDIAVEEVTPNRCDGAISGPVKTGGNQDGFLEPGEVWTYGCDHVVTANDPDPLPNEAKVTGTDTFGRHTTNSDTFSVDIIKPAISLDKKVEGADHKPIGDALVVHSGDLVHYIVTIKNTGDTPLTISSLTDSLKAALGATCDPSPAASLAINATITCEYTANPTADAHNVSAVTAIDTLGGDPGIVTASDETFVDVIHPAITVNKTGAERAHEGDPVTYTFTVHNSGDVPLTGVSVDDNVLGHIGDITTLPVGGTVVMHLTSPAPANDVTNTGTACGLDPLESEVCGHHDHHLDVIHPAITIVKTGPAQAHAGDPVVYHFAVHNAGDVPLTNVSVDDNVLGHIGDIATLAVGATDTSLSKETTAPDADVRNVATACGADPLEKQICNTGDHLLDIINPGIDIVKSAVTQAHVGDVVTYTFSVHNTGDVALNNVSVDDNVLGHIGTIPTIAAGETVALTKDMTVPAAVAGVDNTATACGVDALEKQLCDTDLHHLTVLHPALTIDKKVGGADHKPVSDALVVHKGDALGYTVVVTNTGDTPLEITALSDTLKSGLGATCGKSVGDTLAPDESTTCVYTTPAGTDDAHNVASVTGVDVLGGSDGTKSASDETFVNVIHPAITVTKTVDPKTVDPGSPATYTYVVTNTGDTALSNVTVTDDVLGDIGTVDSLAPGESKTLTTTVTIKADSPRTNVATACGVDALALKVCATAKATITIVLPLPPQHRAPTPRVTVTPPRTLPHTGFRLFMWIAIGIDLIAAGFAMLEAQRRSRRV